MPILRKEVIKKLIAPIFPKCANGKSYSKQAKTKTVTCQ